MQTVAIWNEELFFEVHERLETIWQKTSGEERKALRGLIKAAAAYVHLEHQNQRAARSLDFGFIACNAERANLQGWPIGGSLNRELI